MPLDPLTLGGITALTAGLLGLTTGFLSQRSRHEQRHHLLMMELEETRTEEARLRQASHQQQAKLQEAGAVRTQLQQLMARHEQLRSAHLAREAEARQQRESLDDALRGMAQQTEHLKGLQDRLRQGERQLRLERDRSRRLAQMLQQIGISPDAVAHEPLSPAHRPASRLALAQLMADTGAEATALLDDRGLALLGAGDADAIDALAAQGALARAICDAAAPALGTPLVAWSLSAHSRGSHLLRLDGHRWLALSGPAACPTQPMTLALLRLIGSLPAAPGTSDQLYIDSPARAEGWSDALVQAATDWRSRCGADAVAIIQGDGALLGASPGTLARNLPDLHQRLCELLPRLARDGWPLEDTCLQGHTHQGTSLSARPLSPDPAGPLVLAFSQRSLSEADLAELHATLRWELRKTPLSIAS